MGNIWRKDDLERKDEKTNDRCERHEKLDRKEDNTEFPERDCEGKERD
jgi:hypothetical protein